METGAAKMVVHQLPTVLRTTPKRKRVAAYCRVSCSKEDMLHSLSAQISHYSRYIQSHVSWEYVGVYADEGITGTKENRPRFQQMLADCRDGKIDMILTKSVSRFARNTVTMLETVRELKELDVDVYFEEQNIHSMNGDGELMLTILASFAQAESESVSENCRWRIRKDFAEGKPMNIMLVHGYRSVDGKIVIDEEEAKVVRWVFDEYIHGVGSPTIAAKLRAKKIPRRYGGEWSTTCVIEMLTNEKYIGDSLLQKTYTENHLTKKTRRNNGELNRYYVDNTHPAIIDRETFDRVQEIMASNRARNNVKKTSAVQYPLSKLIVCENCGAYYTRRTRSRGRDSVLSYAWQCSTYLRFGKTYCPANQIPEDTLFELTCEVLGVQVVDDETVKAIESIRVIDENKLRFVLKNGRMEERQWTWRSRSESWTPEMRRKAGEQTKRRRSHE